MWPMLLIKKIVFLTNSEFALDNVANDSYKKKSIFDEEFVLRPLLVSVWYIEMVRSLYRCFFIIIIFVKDYKE